MKFPINASTLMPVITYKNLILLQIIGLDEARSANFWSHSVAALALMTVVFFLTEWMWFLFRTKIVKAHSAYPFWKEFLGQVLTNTKTIGITAAWLLFIALTFATIAWVADSLTETSVAYFGFYLTLSLLLNFYMAALFSVWHLFLSPFLASSSHAKLHRNQ